jgi:hypothetical protein
VHFMYEQLVKERIQRLHDEAAQLRLEEQARRAVRLTRTGRGWRRFSRPASHSTLAEASPSHSFETTAAST